jgi:hypothetical protein
LCTEHGPYTELVTSNAQSRLSLLSNSNQAVAGFQSNGQMIRFFVTLWPSCQTGAIKHGVLLSPGVVLCHFTEQNLTLSLLESDQSHCDLFVPGFY